MAERHASTADSSELESKAALLEKWLPVHPGPP